MAERDISKAHFLWALKMGWLAGSSERCVAGHRVKGGDVTEMRPILGIEEAASLAKLGEGMGHPKQAYGALSSWELATVYHAF